MSLVSLAVPPKVSALLAPVDPAQPAGGFDEENETYQAIDQEMLKLGGLREGSIDWPYVEEAASQYLTSQCKHFRIAFHLLTGWLSKRTWPDGTHAASLVAGLVDQYWESAYPKPDPTGYLAKRKMIVMWVERLSDALAHLAPNSYSKEQQGIVQQALDSLQANAASAKLDVPLLTRLESLFSKAAAKASMPEASTPKPAAGQKGEQSLNSGFFQRKATCNLVMNGKTGASC